MKPSSFDEKPVLHVDGAGITHGGVIVGQSDDGEWFYVKSGHPAAKSKAGWDFQVGKHALPTLMKNAKPE